MLPGWTPGLVSVEVQQTPSVFQQIHGPAFSLQLQNPPTQWPLRAKPMLVCWALQASTSAHGGSKPPPHSDAKPGVVLQPPSPTPTGSCAPSRAPGEFC